MDVNVTKVTPDWLANRAGEMTTHGREIKASDKMWFETEHSPIRAIQYWIEMEGIESFVSTHTVRHKIGTEHFVMSKRDDLRPDKDEVVDRNSLVNHGMLVNAGALIFIARRRLCYKSHKRTVAMMKKIASKIPELKPYLVPECVYRNGICPELSECNPSLEAVMKAYDDYPMLPKNRVKRSKKVITNESNL